MTTSAEVPLFEPSTLQLKVDFDANAAYIRLSHEKVARTRRFEGSESVLVKLDAGDRPIGIEVIGLHTELPLDRLAQVFNFSESLIVQLKGIQDQLWQAGWETSKGDALRAPSA